jgi:hypothetical protein
MMSDLHYDNVEIDETVVALPDQKSASVPGVCKEQLIMFRLSDAARTRAGLPLGDAVPMVSVIGIITGITEGQPVEGSTRMSQGLSGKFELSNLVNGEITTARTLYLPGGFHDQVLEDAGQIIERLDGGEMQFAHLFIACKALSATNPAGYTWRCQPLAPTKRQDPLARLRLRARQALPGATSRVGSYIAIEAPGIEALSEKEKLGEKEKGPKDELAELLEADNAAE